MAFGRYLRLGRRWLWLVVVCVAVAGVGAFVFSKRQTPMYRSSTKVLINLGGQSSNNFIDTLGTQQLAKTYQSLIVTAPVLNKVAQNLSLPSGDVFGHVSASPLPNTQLIEITATALKPQQAARIANEVGKVFAEQIRAQQVGDIDNSIKAIQANIDQTQKQVDDLNAQSTAVTKRTDISETDRQTQLATLSSQINFLVQTLGRLNSDLVSAQVSEAQAINTVTPVEPAVAASSPYTPHPVTNAIVAAVLGALLAVGIASLFEYFDDSLPSPDDLESQLGLAYLGGVPRVAQKRRGRFGRRQSQVIAPLAVGTEVSSGLLEAYRIVRTNLEFSMIGRESHTILVTSSNPGEGKTTTASHLALVLAQRGHRTILVDCDLRRPAVHRAFGIPNRAGLSNWLLRPEESEAHIIQPSRFEHLSLISSGPVPPNASELLASPAFKQALERLERSADVVIIDSPPLRAVADASIIAGIADTVVLVVDEHQTKLHALRDASRILQRLGARVAGVVLNKLDERGSGYGNYYYYSYGKYGVASNALSVNGASSNGKAHGGVALPAEEAGAHREISRHSSS